MSASRIPADFGPETPRMSNSVAPRASINFGSGIGRQNLPIFVGTSDSHDIPQIHKPPKPNK
jgi:hypothetical protein